MNHEELIAALNKDFGKATVVRGVDRTVSVIPTGCIALDSGLGVGGIPTKRITEYFGGESSGKTTMALQVAANAQRMGKNVVYVDAEHALDIQYAEALDVDTDKLVVVQPDDAESALELIAVTLDKYKDDLGVIILDSIAAMVPKAEAASESGDASVGLHARLISQFIRKVTPLLAHTDAALLLINQQRSQIGGFSGFGGPSKTTPGGHALKHGASLRVEFARTGNIQSKDSTTGIKVVANIRKNKVAPPFQKVNYEIEFGKGTSLESQILGYAVELGIIDRKGAWYNMDGSSIGQGLENAVGYLKENNLMHDLGIKVMDGLIMPAKSKDFYKSMIGEKYARISEDG